MANIKKLAAKDTWKGALKQPKANDWVEVAAKTTLDVAAATVGGLGGSFFGWISVPAGIVFSAVGHYSGHRWLSSLGVGIIAAPFNLGGRKAEGEPFSLKAEFEAGKQRAKEYVEMLKEKFLINKITGKNQNDAEGETTSSTNETTVNGLDPGISKATLDQLTEFENQIISEGIEFQAKNGSSPDSGAAIPVNGFDYEIDQLPHII